MRKFVIVATKGRAAESARLLDFLYDQDVLPDGVYLVGSEARDLPDVSRHPLAAQARVTLLVSERPGSTVQRNVGIDALLRDLQRDRIHERWFAVFFDDDFRPHSAWLRHCDALFDEAPHVVGMSGHVLADGVKGRGLTDVEARLYLTGLREPQAHWASGAHRKEVGVAYGCNMAFVDRVVRDCRFDEALPLYGWQEDYDYTSQARRYGLTVYEPTCRGVHLGVKSGRVSGLRFGYSQIANPIYLVGKHTMERKRACLFITKHLLSNVYHSVRGHPLFDYRGRLKGNVLALADMLRGSIDPRRVLDI